MGKLVWHEYARYLSISASVRESLNGQGISLALIMQVMSVSVWASFWGFFYRKFFWDFIGGTLRNPGGIQCVSSTLYPDVTKSLGRPSPKVAIFVALIVKVPAVQILTMVLGFFMLAIEYPLPYLRHLAIQRSLVLRVVVLILQASSAILLYQVCPSLLLHHEHCSLL